MTLFMSQTPTVADIYSMRLYSLHTSLRYCSFHLGEKTHNKVTEMGPTGEKTHYKGMGGGSQQTLSVSQMAHPIPYIVHFF
jgi:hypothetical protein